MNELEEEIKGLTSEINLYINKIYSLKDKLKFVNIFFFNFFFKSEDKNEELMKDN